MDSRRPEGTGWMLAPVPPAGRGSATASVADRLVTGIAVGAFSPGERLPPERELAERLEVSRVTLRQALQQVAEQGLIEVRRGRGGGSFVSAVSWELVAPDVARRVLEQELPRLLDLFDYRLLVEGMIARAAAGRRTDHDIAQLQEGLEQFCATGSMIEARAADRRLHGLVGAAARNPHLVAESVRLTTAVTLGFGAEPYEQEFFDRALWQHEELVGHVVAGTVEAAGTSAEAHFSLTLETMQASLRRAASRPGADRPPAAPRQGR
ncbi:MAG: GntR family transcriptional regulator [Actinomycetota bacterium]|nr:GntR family transcriptional regulator [Actinomycetota bacterium]